MHHLIEALFFLIPIGALTFFFISLERFFFAKKRNKRSPGSYSESQIRTRKILLIISSVIAGILLAVVIGLIALMYMAVAYM